MHTLAEKHDRLKLIDVHRRAPYRCIHQAVTIQSLHQITHLCKLIEQAQMRQYIDSYINDTLLQIRI